MSTQAQQVARFRPWIGGKEIRLYADHIERGSESRRLTGIIASAHGSGPTCGITISGADFAWSPKVNSGHMSGAHKFAAQVTQAVRRYEAEAGRQPVR
jgi:hypothetical protein